MITRYLAGLILIAIPVFVGNAVAGDLLWIELKSDVSVTAQYYTLGELATRVVAEDSALAADVKRLRIGHAPRMGYSTVVPRSEVLRVIRSRYPALRERVHVTGSDAVRLKSIGRQSEMGSLIRYGRDSLLSHLTRNIDADARYELEPLNAPQDLRLPHGTLSYRTRAPSRSQLSARMCVWLDIFVDGDRYQSLPLWFKVKAYKDVYVFKRNVSARTGFKQRHLRIEPRDIASLTGNPVAIDAELDAVWLVRYKTKKSVLLQRDVEPLPVVLKKQTVVVRLASGPIQIETTGIAKADGKLGDAIKVENPTGTGSFMAKVVDVGVVAVQ